ncbi:hypothetical protein E2C01_043986 [Portunus trituberculatus]|uniref:Uncharacterized protein n=1 Tax=Portunus trituberculatus TaxID=210409 RepID=A0A5B7FYQ6_PORTR|nr:hypothetical protein [Portunus trituberculatus]
MNKKRTKSQEDKRTTTLQPPLNVDPFLASLPFLSTLTLPFSLTHPRTLHNNPYGIIYQFLMVECLVEFKRLVFVERLASLWRPRSSAAPGAPLMTGVCVTTLITKKPHCLATHQLSRRREEQEEKEESPSHSFHFFLVPDSDE